MREKILALLIAKFAGVRKDGLAQLASSMSLQVDTEEDATALVEKMTFEKVDNFVKDWRKDVDKEVSEANKTYEGNLKKKYDLVEKKETEPGKDSKPADQKSDDTPGWAKALIEKNEALEKKLNAFEGQKNTETRLQQLEAKFKNVPDAYKAQRIADAKLFIGNMDDAAFSEYLTKTETDITAFNQELTDKGLSGQSKPLFGSKTADGVSSSVKEFVEGKSEGSGALTGKEV